jgi:hypothetical protein
MRTIALWMAALAALALTASPGLAAEDPAVRDAQARFEEGLERVKTGDYEAARISFAQAYALLKRPAILWNLALAEEKTGHLVDALTHFKHVARDASASPGDREDAERHAIALAARTGHIDIQAPAGSALRVDGDAIEATAPLEEPLDVTVGHHVVEARWADGARSAAADVGAGQVAHVTLSKDTAAPVASAPTERPAAPVGPSPAAPPTVGVGTEPVLVSHHETPVAKIATTASLGGAAVVAVGVAIGLALESQSKANQANRTRGMLGGDSECSVPSSNTQLCSQLNSAVQAQNHSAEASDALYVTGGVLAAGAVVVWFLWPRSRTEPSAWLTPVVGTSQVGLEAGGRF